MTKKIPSTWQICTEGDFLRLDPKARDLVADTPQITYRRARALREELTTSHYESGVIRDPCTTGGSFPCGDCPHCKYNDNGLHALTIHGVHLEAKHFANCRTRGIIYLLLCRCKAYYVGKTKREWRCRISKHCSDIWRKAEKSPIAGHMACQHEPDPPFVRFIALDRIHPNIRGATGIDPSMTEW